MRLGESVVQLLVGAFDIGFEVVQDHRRLAERIFDRRKPPEANPDGREHRHLPSRRCIADHEQGDQSRGSRYDGCVSDLLPLVVQLFQQIST